MSRKIILILTSLLCVLPFGTSMVSAAEFTPAETAKIQQLRQDYSALDQTTFNATNLYAVKPQLSRKFKEGILAPAYLEQQLAYINYYRQLFNLEPVSDNHQDNINAQKTAAVLALLNANPLINQHNLPYEKKPKIINRGTWQIARKTSNAANLNFNTCNQSAGDVVTDLLTDSYNLTGTDTGHRAWLLSTKLTTIGIGAAYGKNGYRYSVQKVINSTDAFRLASQAQVAYPEAGVFPIEILKGKNIAWSLYFSDQVIEGTPKITITDEDSGISYQAEKVENFSSAGYGNFQSVITYLPGDTPLIPNHEYRVDISGITSYHFKLFQLKQ
ncbi:CAP domain-containing protein [Lactobacillus apis]|uniref:CAP domain-containing protein n=1 Tax=Lactobacillus apis TaxID=303541 RepID=UPI00274107ED|nr:CAP domain-containing protein [Lactobacillus apis]WLS85064.1 CAP domain-containing protein [Lactobacillus apis]